ncbi:MAG: Stealth CR1 domain-containing protein [Rikenellaceae bacterium]|nr:Stealth CR1 domain-containing protein [Rikenellaceae bacterium]MCL2692981.1 Stealth CR1 domain-containing protein [Rikenellaceae bacterium]
MEIDFVVTWVDMNDPEWRKTFAEHKGIIDNSKNETTEARFRDYGLLKYWFRGVEKFAPWVRKVHFVTCGQKPEWLNADHPKLNLVDHKDYMPAEFLPCFNSNVIEIYMHRIAGLSEHFVYFNDDFFLIDDTLIERFFQDGLPCDIAAFRINAGTGLWNQMLRNNIRVINSRFDKREVMARDYDKWFFAGYGKRLRLTKLLRGYKKFTCLRTPHNAQPYLRTTFDQVWDYAGEELTRMSANRFRTGQDLSLELFKTWQICESNFVPYNTYDDTKMFSLVVRWKAAIEAIREQKYKLVCLNDSPHIRNFDEMMRGLTGAFDSILPEKSGFEK